MQPSPTESIRSLRTIPLLAWFAGSVLVLLVAGAVFAVVTPVSDGGVKCGSVISPTDRPTTGAITAQSLQTSAGLDSAANVLLNAGCSDQRRTYQSFAVGAMLVAMVCFFVGGAAMTSRRKKNRESMP
jgi:hypothetical protein